MRGPVPDENDEVLDPPELQQKPEKVRLSEELGYSQGVTPAGEKRHCLICGRPLISLNRTDYCLSRCSRQRPDRVDDPDEAVVETTVIVSQAPSVKKRRVMHRVDRIGRDRPLPRADSGVSQRAARRKPPRDGLAT